MKEMVKIIGGAALLYCVIVLFIALLPAIDLSKTPAGPGVVPLTPLEAHGRQVFAANGCAYCHTQQVRPTPADANLGRPMAPGDFKYRTPVLAGSERTGPDLTNVGTTRGSDVWQYIHLYDPRAVEPESIMPNFKFLFRVVDKVPEGETAVPLPPQFAPRHGYVIPTADAKALVAYLLSLKQTKIPGYGMNGGMGGTTSAGAPAAAGGASTAGDAAQGASLYSAHCAACHQASGEGLPGAFPPLKGNAVVLDKDPTEHIHVVLNGLHGKAIDGVTYGGAMPPFAGLLNDAEIAAIINHERTSWGNAAPTVTAADVKAVRAGKPVTAPAAAPAASPAASAAAPTPEKSAYQFDAKRGDVRYASTCAACHQVSGEGLPGAFPPLKGNAVVLADDPAEHLGVILHGVHGKTIDGKTYSSPMPPFGGQLDDEQVADIANHERTSWGNAARQVTPADVAKIRAEK